MKYAALSVEFSPTKIESHGEWGSPEYHDTASSGQKKEAKAFTIYKMGTEKVSERYIVPCFVNGLEAYDGEINLEHDKNMIFNEYAVKLCLGYEVKNGDKVVKKELIVALRRIADFGNRIITICPDLDPFNDVDYDKANDLEDDWEVILEGIYFGDIPEIDGLELPPYICNMGKSSKNKKKPSKNYKMKYDDKGPSLTVNCALTREEVSREELEKDLWERILELEEEANEEMIREYKLIKEKEDLDVVVLPIRLEGRVDTYALADTGSNINIIPYRIFEEIGREHVKPIIHNVSMLNHSEAEPMGMLKDVLCQVSVTTVIAKFLILDMSVDQTILIIAGRSFLHTCGGIINTLKGTTSTFDSVCHQKFYVVEMQNNGEESDNDDEEEDYLKRDEMGRPFYGPNLISYFDHNDPMERALAIQDSINPFRKIYV
ncbi:putative reverse transcriptase domain-containing protein [Tanacetum coccineum]